MAAMPLDLKINPRLDWRAAWHWWREGLLAWLPRRMRRWLAGSSRRLVIRVDEGGYVLVREAAGQAPQELERLEPVSPDWSGLARRFRTEQARRLVLRVPADHALIRTLPLPLAAEKNLRQVMGFEMDRLTPFAAAQVYYDVIVLERQPEQRRLRVELTALPRTAVEPVLAQLRQQGLSPDVLDVAGRRPELNLLPLEQRPRRGMWAKRVRSIVIVVVALLVGAAALLPIWQQRLLTMEITARIDQVQKAANQALALRDQLDRALEASNMLSHKKQTIPPQVDVLRELTLILPNDTWLERLQIKGDSLQIIGQSAKASALIGLVEASPLLGSAAFMSPVTTDPRTNKERFVLGARIGKEH
jgi:general secretion pathway protein L